MKSFSYTAADQAGIRRRGTVVAQTAAFATESVARLGLFPIDVREVTGYWRIGRPASRKDLSILFRSLASLVEVGAPLPEAVRLSRQVVAQPVARLLDRVAEGLQSGDSLSAALSTAGVKLPTAATGLLAAAERGSRLTTGLAQVAALLERQAAWIGRTRQALAYPALLAAVGCFSVVLIVGVVVPRFAAMLADLDQQPPWATGMLLAAATGARRFGPWRPSSVAWALPPGPVGRREGLGCINRC